MTALVNQRQLLKPEMFARVTPLSEERQKLARIANSALISEGLYSFVFVEKEPGRGWARYVRTFQEAIRVYVDAQGTLRTDHDLWIWGARFLRLHYRMRKRGAA